jgi:phage terminase Nu1 subunit (DNA packaging protein)
MSTINPEISSQQNHQPEQSLWTVKDVARFVKCSVRHVGNLQRAGLPFIKLGYLTRFDSQVVKRWMGLKPAH